MYSKANCRPTMQQADYERVASVYAKLREEAGRTRGMPMAVRHLESMIRMAEAHARMHLRDYVKENDITVAVRWVPGSLVILLIKVPVIRMVFNMDRVQACRKFMTLVRLSPLSIYWGQPWRNRG